MCVNERFWAWFGRFWLLSSSSNPDWSKYPKIKKHWRLGGFCLLLQFLRFSIKLQNHYFEVQLDPARRSKSTSTINSTIRNLSLKFVMMNQRVWKVYRVWPFSRVPGTTLNAVMLLLAHSGSDVAPHCPENSKTTKSRCQFQAFYPYQTSNFFYISSELGFRQGNVDKPIF